MVSKWVADAMGKEGIYASWIAMRQYPWLHPGEYRDNGETAAQIVKSVENLIIIHDETEPTLKELRDFFAAGSFHGYPAVRGEKLLGYVDREKALAYIGRCILGFDGTELRTDVVPLEPLVVAGEEPEQISKCTFSREVAATDSELVNLSPLLDEAVLQLRKEVPLEVVVSMFQKLVCSAFPCYLPDPL